MISELYQQILPTAQRLLDDLLSGPRTLEINAQPGAPDPTAGGSVGEISTWCLDSKNSRSRTHSENKTAAGASGSGQHADDSIGGGAVRCSISSEGDEGVEEAPSQSEGEQGEGDGEGECMDKMTDRLSTLKVKEGTEKVKTYFLNFYQVYLSYKGNK